MKFIPIMLNVTGKKLLIIGGGKAAAQKLNNLSSKFDRIIVVADEFKEMIEGKNVETVRLHITEPSQLDKFIERNTIVVIASDEPELNEEIRDYCERKGVLFNSVDRRDSPFIFPAVLDSNGVIVSVSTEGKSPSLSRFLRKKISSVVNSYSCALPILEKVRNEIIATEHSTKAIYFQRLFEDDNFWKLVDKGQDDAAFTYALNVFKTLKLKSR
ncbi:MAG: bifunctional precorrin-2 dehydrogenase/sirohydrochlorin ferrochelatase [Thermoplasmatales archaeon]